MLLAAPMTPHTEVLILMVGTLAVLGALTVLNFFRQRRQYARSRKRRN